MPVVVIAAPAHGDAAEVLVDVSTAVAHELGLQPEDVIVTLTPVTLTVRGQDVIAAWPVVTAHGGRRPAAAAALDAARRIVAQAWHVPADGVWTEWVDAST